MVGANPVHHDRQPALVGGCSQNRLDLDCPVRWRSQLADTAIPAADDFPFDIGRDLPRGLVQVDLAETDEPAGMCGDRGIEFLPRSPVAVPTLGPAADRLAQHPHLAPEAGQVGGSLWMRPGAEEHGAIGSRLVQQGDVTVHRIVDMAVRIDDQRTLLVRAAECGRWDQC